MQHSKQIYPFRLFPTFHPQFQACCTVMCAFFHSQLCAFLTWLLSRWHAFLLFESLLPSTLGSKHSYNSLQESYLSWSLASQSQVFPYMLPFFLINAYLLLSFVFVFFLAQLQGLYKLSSLLLLSYLLTFVQYGWRHTIYFSFAHSCNLNVCIAFIRSCSQACNLLDCFLAFLDLCILANCVTNFSRLRHKYTASILAIHHLTFMVPYWLSCISPLISYYLICRLDAIYFLVFSILNCMLSWFLVYSLAQFRTSLQFANFPLYLLSYLLCCRWLACSLALTLRRIHLVGWLISCFSSRSFPAIWLGGGVLRFIISLSFSFACIQLPIFPNSSNALLFFLALWL